MSKQKKVRVKEVKSPTVKGFFAICDFTKSHKPIVNIGYRSTKSVIYTNDTLITADLLLIQVVESIKTEFDAFLVTLYRAGVSISNQNKYFDLTSEMLEAGLIDYSTFTSLDPSKVVDAFADVDPSDFETMLGDKSTIIDVLKHLGLSGLLHHLYAAGKLTFQEYKECVYFFYPDKEERAQYYENINPALRSRRIMLSGTEEKEILG